MRASASPSACIGIGGWHVQTGACLRVRRAAFAVWPGRGKPGHSSVHTLDGTVERDGRRTGGVRRYLSDLEGPSRLRFHQIIPLPQFRRRQSHSAAFLGSVGQSAHHAHVRQRGDYTARAYGALLFQDRRYRPMYRTYCYRRFFGRSRCYRRFIGMRSYYVNLGWARLPMRTLPISVIEPAPQLATFIQPAELDEAALPAPASFALFAVGLAGLGAGGWRKRCARTR